MPLAARAAPCETWRQYPIYGEIFEEKATDARASTVRKVLSAGLTPALIPGGFSEAVYTGASPTEEFSYIADRRGFIKIAIEHGIDIIPAYSYGINDMYSTLAWNRHWRAVVAQASGVVLASPRQPAHRLCKLRRWECERRVG